MRKTSPYARKKARMKHLPGKTYKAGDFILHRTKIGHGLDDVIARCTPFRDNTILDGNAYLAPVRLSLQKFIDRAVAPDDFEQYNILSFALNECKARYYLLGGNNEDVIQRVEKSIEALRRSLERWQRIHEWGLDGPAFSELVDGIGLYEEVFWASSPNQMNEAAVLSLKHTALIKMNPEKEECVA